MEQRVLDWLQEAPFSNPDKITAQPTFSYEDWFARGRALHAADTLIELLNREDPEHPSGNGMRAAYALGWVGQQGDKRSVAALLRSLRSRDVTLRTESASALGLLGGASELPILERLLTDTQEDVNVRANACIAIGRLGVPSSQKLLESTLKDPNAFLARCAERALKLLKEKSAPAPK